MSASIRVAQVKVVPRSGELRANHELLMEALSEISPHRPDVVVTPEGFLDGYVANDKAVPREQMGQYAIDPAGSEFTRAAAAWARGNECWLIYGCTRRDGGRHCNSALIYDRAGRQVGCYDKVHLQRHDLKYDPGDRLCVFEADFGPYGVMICADRRWPETVRTLAMRGARVIFNPTYGMHNDLNLAMMRTRAYENGLFIVFTHPVQSLITGPGGEVLVNNTDDAARFTITEIDLSSVDAARTRDYPAHLRDRRPEVYEP